MKVCSYFNGGDSVTIEQYVLHSLRNAGAKLHKIILFQCLGMLKSINCDDFVWFFGILMIV